MHASTPQSSSSNKPSLPQAQFPVRHQDLEIKDAQIIFDAVWHELEDGLGRDNLRFPKEIILLGGAPGSGKGTNTAFIMATRGLTCEPIIVSGLLDTPEARALKDGGNMVGDREVVRILFHHLLKPEYRDGVVLDGFPRTKVQVECLKLLVDQIHCLWREHADTPLRIHFRQPTIHIMVLFVDEKTSIERQLKRGHEIKHHNEDVRRTSIGELLEERPTDFDVDLARRRYRIFKEQTWGALQSLKEIFHYHFVNAQGLIKEVEHNILKELQYQSSLELDPRTYSQIHLLPVSDEIVRHARQDLVKRLDSYALENAELFGRIIAFIQSEIMPVVKRHAISGLALFNTEDPRFAEQDALAMLIDIFSERGFHAVVDLHHIEVPESVCLKTGQIQRRSKKVYRIQVRFSGSVIRQG